VRSEIEPVAHESFFDPLVAGSLDVGAVPDEVWLLFSREAPPCELLFFLSLSLWVEELVPSLWLNRVRPVEFIEELPPAAAPVAELELVDEPFIEPSEFRCASLLES
jgi:hypothetical protein